MKWKCQYCSYGPCVYECVYSEAHNKPAYKAICPMGMQRAVWIKMYTGDPERKEESGLPEWLKVGNFVWIDATMEIIKGGAASYKGVYRIEKIEHGFMLVLRKRGDNDMMQIACTESAIIRRVNMRQVFPKPYTFDTAPVIFKARRKADGAKVVLCLAASNNCLTAFCAIGETGTIFISFADVLRYYEQMDGWPCGTFDEDGGNEK